MKFYTKLFLFISATMPVFAFADSYLSLQEPKDLTQFVNNFLTILNGDLGNGVVGIVQFIIFFCFFGMVIGILKYVGAGADEERLGKAKQLIVYGLVGMVIAFSFWGLASLIVRTYLGI